MARGRSQVTQKLISKNGMMLWIPQHMTDTLNASPRITDVDIYAESTSKLFPLGSRLELGDGRLFRYGKWGATSTNVPKERLVVNANAGGSVTGFVGTDAFEGNCYVAGAVGDAYVDLWTIIAASGTGYRTTVFPKDHFEDGMFVAFCDTAHLATRTHFACYRICGSDATVTPYTRIYLDADLVTGLIVGTTGAYVTTGTLTDATGGTGVDAYPSIYSQLKDAAAEGSTYVAAMGIFHGPVFTAASYGWIQRRGLCNITPTAYLGDAANERMAQLHTDGTVAVKAAHGTHTVGYVPMRTASGYGDLMVYLQLE